jgi:hypothetical protein
MYSFILQLVVMVSLAVIIYLVARTIPRIDENAVLGERKRHFFDDFVSKLPLEKVDSIFSNLLEKMLRRSKIVIMKIDNILTRKISSFKPLVSKEKDLRPNIFEKSVLTNGEDKNSEESIDK